MLTFCALHFRCNLPCFIFTISPASLYECGIKSPGRSPPWQNNSNNNNNKHDNVYGAIIVAEPLREFTRFIWWMSLWNGAKRSPTLRPGQTTWAVSPPVGCQKPHPPSPFIIITQPESLCSFYHPTESRRLSRPRHCSKDVQPVPKAVYRSVFTINMQLPTVRFEPWSSHTAVRHVTARSLRQKPPCMNIWIVYNTGLKNDL